MKNEIIKKLNIAYEKGKDDMYYEMTESHPKPDETPILFNEIADNILSLLNKKQ